MKKLITYNDTIEIIKKKISESNKTTREISVESKVSYNIVSLIKNNYKKPFPTAIIKLLNYFKIAAKRVKGYEIEENN